VGSVTLPAWAVTIVAAIIIGLIGLVWRDLIKRMDSISSKLDGHVAEDARAHERITVLETRVATNTTTIQENYNKFHRFQVEMREGAAAQARWLTDKFESLFRWLTEKVIERMSK
jgi:uncharacterized coiled-coil protein SlyX